MALSNWDTWALDEKGEPIPGSFTSPLGVEVEVYKNWLYVQDERAWVEGGAYIRPIIMEIQSGELTYKDVHVSALRGPQEGVYAVVYTTRYPPHVEGEPYKPPTYTGMIGVGVYGYHGEEWVGVLPESIAWFREQVKNAEKMDVPREFRDLDWSKGRRFNQGDAFFAKNLGFETPATREGETETPILSQMLRR